MGGGSAGPGTSAPSFQQFQPIAAFSISLKFQVLKYVGVLVSIAAQHRHPHQRPEHPPTGVVDIPQMCLEKLLYDFLCVHEHLRND